MVKGPASREASSLTTKKSLLFSKENVDTRAVRCGRGLAPMAIESHRLTHNGVVSGLAPRGGSSFAIQLKAETTVYAATFCHCYQIGNDASCDLRFLSARHLFILAATN